MAKAVPTNKRAILLAIFVAFGCLIMPDFIRRFGTPDTANLGEYILDSNRQSIITSLLSAGTFVGALAQAFTSDRFGRRGSIFIWAAIFTVGTAVQTGTTTSIAQISVGRFIAGLGVGAMSAIVPLYNGETAPKALRGMLLVLYQLQISYGVTSTPRIFISYIIDLGTHTISGSASWRIPVGLQMLWGLIILSGIFFLPESPRHLLGTDRTEDARKVIAELNSTVEELMFSIRAENENGKATWLECFSTRNALWKRTINGMMLQFIQQLNGQNFYYYYGDTFFQNAGTELSPYVIQTILGAVSVVGTVPALYLIEAWGRRRSLLVGSVLEAICSLIAGLVGHFTLAPSGTPASLLTPRNKQGGDALIAFAVLHVFSFAVFWGPVPWVYLGESFPLRVRPKAIALGSATNWLWNFLLSFFAPRIANDIGPLILLIFFGMLVFGYAYVYLLIPETKGLSLEEVDEMYRSGVKPWNSPSWKPHLLDHMHGREAASEACEVEVHEKDSA
ncbi:general substrate transporter [Armillaria mellea]|nr:general substrate transporter [Armillaria mellea]